MFSKTLIAAAALVSTAVAHPVERATTTTDNIDVLQFALTLEHLEHNFYDGALKMFSEQDFADAGYGADYYTDLEYISMDEAVHVQLLKEALEAVGQTPVKACTYDFGYSTVLEFITISSILEGVGTGAYLGAAPLVTGEYLTVAGAILAVEALHTSMQRAALYEVPQANPLYTPLDGDSAYSLAALFITSCPSSNAPLPFSAFPTLTYDSNGATCEVPDCSSSTSYGYSWHGWNGNGGWSSSSSSAAPAQAGQTVMFTAEKDIPAGSYVTFISGLTVTSVAGTIDGNNVTATIPSGIAGQSYAFVTSNSETALTDADVLFGPAVVEVNPALY